MAKREGQRTLPLPHAPSPEVGAAAFVPRGVGGGVPSVAVLTEAARSCTGCPLYERATQTVFGEGPEGARIMVVGEQPGDVEDREGRPFVGPAGAILDKALAQVGLAREEVFITNAVKHFNFVEQGKRRIHQKPAGRDVRACRPWLEAEIDRIQPQVIVCLGATAASSLLGSSFRLTQARGKPIASRWAKAVLATYHPSAILRAPTPDERHALLAELVTTLRTAASLAGYGPKNDISSPT